VSDSEVAHVIEDYPFIEGDKIMLVSTDQHNQKSIEGKYLTAPQSYVIVSAHILHGLKRERR